MCFDHDYFCDFHRAEIRVARKTYRCEECDVPIVPGQRHEFASGKCEGMMYSYRRCLPCLSLRDAVVAHEEAEGCVGIEAYPPIGELWECARDVGVVVRVYELADHQQLARENAADGMPF